MYYYNLDIDENDVFIFERFDRSNCSSEEWYFNDDLFFNPSAPTDEEIALLDMIYAHKTSIKTVWIEFQEVRFLQSLK
ncbi:hypothetical protein PI91_00520 [Enterobacter sp. FB]|jgi:hypothetical protein|nr:hypothetical protein PI91_00520 [Enterobacter sp. FB]OIR47524.1 hypothetical protein BH716_00525 [Lelliottia nimipressuralis]BCU51092.1 hypothetical protein CIAM_46130 [Citrobacter amalonaticus]STA62836.1 Uncharacterised protein [Citrobacter amalonaticus]